jgi:F-type H+-transporting ATPase subunit delta
MTAITHTDALANVYARSLFELAQEAGGRDKAVEVGQELEQICELARQDQKLREFFASPIIDVQRRGKAIDRIFNNRVTDLMLRFLLVLNEKGRLRKLEGINAAYERLIQEAFDRIEVNVYTAAPLGDEQVELLKSRIQNALKKEPVLHCYTDEGMLGGVKLRIGDQMIDGSIASRLKNMHQQLRTRGVSAMRDRFEQIIDKETE